MQNITGNTQCPTVTWCGEGTSLHTLHQATLGTWFGEALDGRHVMTTQLVVYGAGERDAYPVVVLLDPRLGRWTCELSWGAVPELAQKLTEAAAQFNQPE